MLRKVLLALAFAAAAFSQNPNTAIYPGGVATDNDLMVASNGASTALTAPATAGDTSISVGATAGFLVPTTITFGDNNEIAKCLTKTSSSFTGCTRGFDSAAGGRTATAHASGVVVRGNAVAYYINQHAAEIKALEANVPANPLTTLGDTPYGGASGLPTRLAGNTSATKKYLTQTGDGMNSAAPAWGTIAAGDVPTLNQSTSGNAATATALAANPTETGCSTIKTVTAIDAGANITCTAIQLAVADGSTLGLAAFAAADFNSSAGLISIDYTNAAIIAGKASLTQANALSYVASAGTLTQDTSTSDDGAGNIAALSFSASTLYQMGGLGIQLRSASQISFSTNGAYSGTKDLVLTRGTTKELDLSSDGGTTYDTIFKFGSGIMKAITAPSTAASGFGNVYVDSTSKNLAVKDDAGVVKHGVQTKAAVTHNFVTAVSDAGVVAVAQPDYSDLSGTPTLRYQTIQEEGSGLTQRATVNFIGTAITCADNSGSARTDCTVALPNHQITMSVGAADIVSTGTKACSVISVAGTIVGAKLVANALPTGANLVVDVLKIGFTSYTGFASAVSVTASAVPTIATGASNPRYTDTTLTGWTTAVSANDVVCVAINTAPTGGATFAALTLEIQ